jgi:hypothetical protein
MINDLHLLSVLISTSCISWNSFPSPFKCFMWTFTNPENSQCKVSEVPSRFFLASLPNLYNLYPFHCIFHKITLVRFFSFIPFFRFFLLSHFFSIFQYYFLLFHQKCCTYPNSPKSRIHPF